MSKLPRRVGTAEREVIHKMLRLPGQRWSTNSPALYESRAFTEELLQSLTGRGFVRETVNVGSPTVYTMTGTGLNWAQNNQLPY